MASLHTRLADTLGISEAEARLRLQDLGDQLRTAVQAEGAVRLPGLGTFRMQDDTLTFEAAESLARSVNQEYAGLTVEPIDPTGSDAHPLPSVTSTLPLSVATLDAPVSRSAATLETGHSPVPPNVWMSHPSTSQATPDQEAAPARSSAPFERQERIFRGAAATVTLLFLLGSGWFMLGQAGLVQSPGSVIARLGGDSAGPSGAASGTASPGTADTTATESRPPDSAAATSTTTPDTAGADTTDPSTGALAATPTDDATRWVLVVGSQADRASADRLADQYRERFASLPVAVHPSITDSGTRYRVTIGQFASRDSALAALKQNQARLPDGAWLLDRP